MVAYQQLAARIRCGMTAIAVCLCCMTVSHLRAFRSSARSYLHRCLAQATWTMAFSTTGCWACPAPQTRMTSSRYHTAVCPNSPPAFCMMHSSTLFILHSQWLPPLVPCISAVANLSSFTESCCWLIMLHDSRLCTIPTPGLQSALATK